MKNSVYLIQRDNKIAQCMCGSRIFLRGVQSENSLDFFFSPQPFFHFTERVQRFFTEKTILFYESRGGPTFSRWWGGGGVQLFQGVGGPNANFYIIETNITCDFPGGGGGPDPPIPPLDLHMTMCR